MDTSAFELRGELDAARVAAVHRRTQSSCRAGNLPQRVDLSRVTQTDSSALALLLDWQEHARRQGRRIEFTTPPDSLRVLAALSQVSSLLGWEDDNSGADGSHREAS